MKKILSTFLFNLFLVFLVLVFMASAKAQTSPAYSIRSGAALPLTCYTSTTRVDVFIRTTDDTLHLCSATNVWREVGSTVLTTKGDIFTFSSANTRLPVGANGLCLKSNSGTATGLQWATCYTLESHNHAAADINSGVFAEARIPTTLTSTFNFSSLVNANQLDVSDRMAVGNTAIINGNYGVNSSRQTLHTNETITDILNPKLFGIRTDLYLNPATDYQAASTPDIIGNQVYMESTLGNTRKFYNLYGRTNFVFHRGTGAIDGVLSGDYIEVQNTASAAIPRIQGQRIWVVNNGTVPLQLGLEVQNNINSGGGVVADARTLNLQLINAGTVTDGFVIRVRNTAGGGTTTNRYGVYIDDQTGLGTTHYNIFSAGATSNNRFEGNVSVGGNINVTGTVTAASFSGSAGTVSFSGTRAYATVNQSAATGTNVAIQLTAERFDTNSYHDNVTNNTRLTAPVTGYYEITANIAFTANATGDRALAFRLNGSTLIAYTNQFPGSAGAASHLSLSTTYFLNAGDYIETIAQQSSGISLNILAIGNNSPEVTMKLQGI